MENRPFTKEKRNAGNLKTGFDFPRFFRGQCLALGGS